MSLDSNIYNCSAEFQDKARYIKSRKNQSRSNLSDIIDLNFQNVCVHGPTCSVSNQDKPFMMDLAVIFEVKLDFEGVR